MKKLFKINPFTISLFIIIMVVLAYSVGISFLDIIELKTIDLRFTTRGKETPSSKVVMAVIDEKSLKNEGKWVWPRSKMARLVKKLSESGASVIGFDIGFLEPDDRKIVHTINKIRLETKNYKIHNPSFENYLEKLKFKSDNDRLLADAIKKSKSKVVLGYFFQLGTSESLYSSAAEIQGHEHNVTGSRYKFVRYSSTTAQHVPMIEVLMPQSNIKIISDATGYSGYFNMIPDIDGVVRWIPAVFKFNGALYAPLSIVSAGAYLDSPISVDVSDQGVKGLNIGSMFVPTDELGRILINYRGPEKTFPHISITDILHDNVPEDLLKDKIVLVGATAVGIYDLRVTPFGTVFPGLEIHANIIDSILQKDFLYKPAWAAIFDVIVIIAGGLLLGIVLPKTEVIVGGLTALFTLLVYVGLCYYLFDSQGMILNMVYPVCTFILVYIGVTAYKYLVETRQKKFIKNAFSTYLAPSVVSQLIQSPEKLELGGEKRIITAFFSDVQGFTSISEGLSPQELVELLNEFLTEMTDIILEHEGTVDKFEGDAIIALFGAPNPIVNQAEVACRACIEMQNRLVMLRAKWKAENRPQLKMRIGLCTGPAVVGNMGSKSRMDYTMMGDTVNTAARLEGVNKVYGIYTLISESTRRTVGEEIMTREIDKINVVGKKEPITIYEVLDYARNVDNTLRETVEYYAGGLKAYRSQDWNRAIILFSKALSINPDDGPSKTLLARCNKYKKDPPPKDWDGVYSMVTK